MKKQVLLRWLWCTLEYSIYFPLVIILAGAVLPYNSAVIVPLMLPFHLLAGLVFTSVLKNFRNYLAALAGGAYVILVVVVCRVLFMSGYIQEYIAVIVGTVFFYTWGVKAGTGEVADRIFLYSVGLFIHLVSLFFISNIDVLKPFFNLAMWVSILYCIVGVPLANRRFLINETHEKSSLRTIPGTVNRGNRIIVIMTLVGIIILSFWQALLDAVNFIAESLSWLIQKIVDLLGSLFQSEEGGTTGPQGMETLPPVEEQNSIITLILNIISVLLLLLVLFLIIRYLVRNYKKIYQALYNLLSSLFGRFQKWSSTEQGYFDREESLLKTEFQRRPSIFRRLFKRYPRWRDMKDNESRVRFIYIRFVLDYIRKGMRFMLSDTPSEVADKARRIDREAGEDHSLLENVYNGVRYGRKPVDDETVGVLKDRYL